MVFTLLSFHQHVHQEGRFYNIGRQNYYGTVTVLNITLRKLGDICNSLQIPSTAML